jgi:hypothetical protein
MSNQNPDQQSPLDTEKLKFIQSLEQSGQLVDVAEHQDTSKLPANVTHVRYPDGTIKRIRITSSGYR